MEGAGWGGVNGIKGGSLRRKGGEGSVEGGLGRLRGDQKVGRGG